MSRDSGITTSNEPAPNHPHTIIIINDNSNQSIFLMHWNIIEFIVAADTLITTQIFLLDFCGRHSHRSTSLHVAAIAIFDMQNAFYLVNCQLLSCFKRHNFCRRPTIWLPVEERIEHGWKLMHRSKKNVEMNNCPSTARILKSNN